MDKDKIKEIKEKMIKATSREKLENLHILLKQEELKGITDHDEYAMRAAQISDLMHQQMEHEGMRATQESEERFRKMMNMGYQKPNIEHNNITQEIIKETTEIEEMKKHR